MQKGKCDFCLSEFTVDDIERLNNENKDHITEENLEEDYNDEWGNLEEKTAIYSCPRCGAEIVSDKTTTATFCCYCHGPVVLNDNLMANLSHLKLFHLK